MIFKPIPRKTFTADCGCVFSVGDITPNGVKEVVATCVHHEGLTPRGQMAQVLIECRVLNLAYQVIMDLVKKETPMGMAWTSERDLMFQSPESTDEEIEAFQAEIDRRLQFDWSEYDREASHKPKVSFV